MEATIKALCENLKASVHHDQKVREAAEQTLKNAAAQKQFAVVLLKILTAPAAPDDVRHAAAIYFKNFVSKRWGTELESKDDDGICVEDRTIIKQHIVKLMLDSPRLIQVQLSAALQEISKYDFPMQWQTLLPELIQKLGEAMGQKNYQVICGALETCNAIFLHYRHDSKSNELWAEIKYVLGEFHDPLLALFKQFSKELGTATEKGDLEIRFKALILVAKIFLSLNTQDLPESFEESMADWMTLCLNHLKYNNPVLATSDDDPGPMEILKTEICDICTLYCAKYDEEFKPFVPEFVKCSWELLGKLDSSAHNDQLVSAALRFLTEVVIKPWHKDMFSSKEVQAQICKFIIVPNIRVRESDLQEFDINPQEYVRKDMEGSDAYTRRRMAIDFVRGLCRYFEDQVSAILLNYVKHLTAEYAKDRNKNWMDEDAAMFLMVAVAVKEQTARLGAVQISQKVNVGEFFSTHVMTELTSGDVNSKAVLKADCLKFVIIFRDHLPVDQFPDILALLMRYLGHPSHVVHSYAAMAIDKILLLREKSPGRPPKFARDKLKPHLKPLLEALFQVFRSDDSADNQHAMRAIMRVCSAAQHDLVAVVGKVLELVTSMLEKVKKNPANPHFTHYLFETLAASIKSVCTEAPQQVEAFETQLFPLFESLLNEEKFEDFHPYIFQLFSQLLHVRPNVSPAYEKIFPVLLNANLWRHTGNVPPLTDLLITFLRRSGTTIVEKGYLEPLLGVFQNLLTHRMNSHHAVAVIKAVCEFIPKESTERYMKNVVMFLLQKYQKVMKDKGDRTFIKELLMFFALVIHRHGFTYVVGITQQVQPNLFHMVLEKIWLPNMKCVTSDLDRKLMTAAMVRLLVQERDFIYQEPYSSLWIPMADALVTTIESDPEVIDPNDREEIIAYDVQYARLQRAKAAPHDSAKDVVIDPRIVLANGLKVLLRENPTVFQQRIQTLKPHVSGAVARYFKDADIKT